MRADTYKKTDDNMYTAHYSLLRDSNVLRAGIVIFSDAAQYGNGQTFAEYLKENKLGKVSVARAYNPNSGHNIALWTWVVDRDALIAWAKVYCK